MAITIENATVTAILNEQEYIHDFVTNITINDPKENMLSVSPQGGGIGVVYRNNTTAPIDTALTVRDLPVELIDLYKTAFKEQLRVDFMIINTATGERYDLNKSIVKSNPTNTTISEGESSLDVILNIITPPAKADHATQES